MLGIARLVIPENAIWWCWVSFNEEKLFLPRLCFACSVFQPKHL